MAVGTIRHSSHWGAFTADVENGRLHGVRPFASDPDPSPIIHSVPDAVHDRSRVARPSIRKGWLERNAGGAPRNRGIDPFVEVPWDEALDMVADELQRVRQEHGNDAIFGGSYGWSSAGRFHHAKSQLQRFLNTIGGFTDQVHTYSIAAGYAILPHVLGSARAAMSEATSWDSIIENTELFVAFGGIPLKNAQVSAGGPAEHTTGTYLKTARDAGIAFVNISPIRGDAADHLEAEWLAIRPNTDVALMLALAHTLEHEDLVDRAFVDRYCTGFPRFRAYLLGEGDGTAKDADWAAAICEIPADTIRALARRMAASRTLINTNWSLQRGDHGEQPFWMTVTLAAMLGGIGLPGQGFGFGYGSMGNVGNPRRPAPSPALTIGRNPCDSWIPVSRIADMLLDPGGAYDFDGERRTYPDIRLIYWSGGNPFHHHQDLNRLVEAWRRPETIIVNEPWWTATAKFSDIVLPSTTTLERKDIGATSRDRFILAMDKAIEPLGEAQNDFDIFRGLARRMGTETTFTEDRETEDWLRHIYDRARQDAARNEITLPSYDEFWKAGQAEIPRPDSALVMLKGFRDDPDAHALPTPSGRIEVFSETVDSFGYEDCPGHPVWREPAEWLGAVGDYPLHMISNQPATRLHGQMDNGRVSRDAKVSGREPVWIHPADAADRGLSDGDVVRVFNARGALLAGVRITDEVRPGVVQLATGAWYDPADPGSERSIDKHGNPNVLTLDKGTSRLGQGPIAHTALVEITAFDGPLPPVTAHVPPRFVAPDP
ncbi:MAG: molybdopterin guanine dinucleotide-containing S/N-oxide reductase [Alphaproteobacteria bacterium]|nr:molybdopterin guanine dinucleotide-containing S/N-oxide reductase [Alphaproteobacteria bacterium]